MYDVQSIAHTLMCDECSQLTKLRLRILHGVMTSFVVFEKMWLLKEGCGEWMTGIANYRRSEGTFKRIVKCMRLDHCC